MRVYGSSIFSWVLLTLLAAAWQFDIQADVHLLGILDENSRAGNVQQIGTQDFRYDRYKRLISGEVTVGAADRTQKASFDVYNNLLSLTTSRLLRRFFPRR